MATKAEQKEQRDRKLRKRIEHLYTMKYGGSADTAALLGLSGALLSTSPLLGSAFSGLPFSLLPPAAAALGAGWMAYRAMEPWRHEHALPSSVGIRSDLPPVVPGPGDPAPGLLIGYKTDTGEPVYIPYATLVRHMFILGQSGVGKTVAASLMMFQQILSGGGLLFIDGKIDALNIEQIYHFCCYAGREHDLIVINPDDPDNSNTYNQVLFGDPDEVADRILQLIPSTESNPGSDHYKQEAKQALTTLIAALQTARMAYNMIDLTVLLMNSNVLLELERKLAHIAPGSEESKNYSLFLDKFRVPIEDRRSGLPPGSIDVKKLKDTFGGIGGRLFSFGTNKFGRVVNTYDPDLNLYEAIRGNKIVYIALPTMGKDTTARNFGKMTIGDLRTAISWLQKLPEDERPWPPFMAFCDEAGSYVNEAWSRIPEQARSARVFFMPAAQTCANFQAISDELYEMVIGNSAVKLFFQIGTQSSAEEAADLIGKYKGVLKSLSGTQTESSSASFLRAAPESNVGSGAAMNTGERQQEMHILSPDQLKSLEKGECIMLLEGKKIYNLRVPMLSLDSATKARFGRFTPNRFRTTGVVRTENLIGKRHYARYQEGANFFKNVDRYLSTADMRSYEQENKKKDKQMLAEEKAKTDAVLRAKGIEPEASVVVEEEYA
ncbi:type IV secretory system conjugative DNA transfer family protein [Cupriavidus malaysiensis]|uniref:TraD/TraG TraM recognition site domain-containing protein n=1 Tax=Cupriavidus malaysiensis TaxID=367825 RepID=A0ABN4TV01_9BURK|nr:TraM recognition domain-containing protein [Cupriavidus malaysiensis]AOZ11082.1 hypothetical protein BKK80_34545 [Cupriavidus malaysiensis]